VGELDGRVAVITGGTRGIGRAIAEQFLAEGAKVVINGRSAEKGAAAKAEMKGGRRLAFVRGDVKKRKDCERLIDTTVKKFGKVDILVNNAGGADNHAPVASLTDEALEDALKWNLWSTFWCSRKVLEFMIPAQWGRIINISSVEGKKGKPGVSTYVVSKHAVNGLTKSMAQEVGTMGITVNALCPGAIETDIMLSAGPGAAEAMGMKYQDLLDWFASESAIKRLNEVEDVSNVALLLASDIGAGITGSLISIDGGTSPY
jgi:3-hydroxybutyrate dehydrogenase